MPVLPTLESSQSVFSTGTLQSQQIQSSPADFGGQVAAAGAQVGQSAQQLGGDLTQVAVAKQAINNESQANNTFATGLAPAVRGLTQGFYQMKGQAAVDAQPQISAAIEDTRQELRASLNPAAARMFDETSLRFLNNEQDGMSRYAAQEQVTANQTASNNMVYAFQQHAADSYKDPIAFNGDLNSVAQERAAQGAVMGQSKLEIANQVVNDQSKMWTDRLRMIATTDPVAAYNMLQSGEYWSANGQQQHTDVLGQIVPTQRAALIDELKKGSDIVSAHSNATAFLTGVPLTAPTGFTDVIKTMESNGNPAAIGPNVPGQGTAKGSMQVMDATNLDPGYGVTPAKDDSPEERARVGHDYALALLAHYADPTKALAAYNDGPGNVDSAVASAGPNWLAQMPPQTKAYVAHGTQLLAQANANVAPGPSPFAPANQPAQGAVTGNLAVPTSSAGQVAPNPVTGVDPIKMEADLSTRAEAARQYGYQLQPNDPSYGDKMYAETMNLGNAQIQAARATQNSAAETLTNNIDSGKVTSMTMLLGDPASKAAYNLLSEKGQFAVQQMMAAPPVKLTNDNLPLYAQLKGESAVNPQGFAKEDIMGSYAGKLPTDVLKELINDQAAIVKGGREQSDKAISLAGSWGNVSDIATNAGITEAKDPASFTQLRGAYLLQLTQYEQQNGKAPDATAQRKIMGTLLTPGTQGPMTTRPGWMGGNPTIPAYKATDLSKFQIPVPDEQRTQLAATFQKVMGHVPTDDELQQSYAAYQLSLKGK
jgi:hypothetical protein